MGRARRGWVALAAACALVVVAWNVGLARDRAGRDPYAVVDEQLARNLQDRRADLHETIGQVRAADPRTTGLEALNDLADATGQRFRYRTVQGDGTTHAELTLVATRTTAFVKNQQSWWTSVCLSLVVEPGRGDGRGSVTTAQVACAPDAPPPRGDPRSVDGGYLGEHRPAPVGLDRVRTRVPAPAPTRARPPVCYSGSSCDETGG